MYALNTFLRFARFVANSIVGIVVGWVIGFLHGSGHLTQLIDSSWLGLR